MNKRGASSGIEGGSQLDGHEEFLQLCSLLTCDGLTSEERDRLESHLEVCPACSRALSDYQRIARLGMPALSPDFVPDSLSATPLRSTESAKTKLFERLSRDNESDADLRAELDAGDGFAKLGRSVAKKQGTRLMRLWESQALLRHAAGILLVVGLSVSTYRLGEKKAAWFRSSCQQSHINDVDAIQQKVAALTQERQALDAQLHERDRAVESVTTKMNQQLLDITRLKEEEKGLQDAMVKAGEERTTMASDRDGVDRQLGVAHTSLTKMQETLDTLRQQRADDLLRATSLEARIGELSEQLKNREDMIAQQQQLLASDRDIRELMVARELYIAEVYDVGRNGKTQKPFGRVFFTKKKSLIFYAYDLDQQPGVTSASAFQAWGRHGPDRKRAVSLGIFYKDDVANKRWVLKVDAPETLEQIDAVFVTVEPSGGSRKPSDKQLLFAYLRVEANHP